MLACEGDHRVEIATNSLEALEVLLDETARSGVFDAQLSRERIGALSVDRGEVDGLRAPAHLRRDLFERNVEDE